MLTDILSAPEVETDLGPDSPCSLRRVVGDRPICRRPAAWAIRLACCGHIKEVCHPHRDIRESILPKRLVCGVCGTLDPQTAERWPI